MASTRILQKQKAQDQLPAHERVGEQTTSFVGKMTKKQLKKRLKAELLVKLKAQLEAQKNEEKKAADSTPQLSKRRLKKETRAETEESKEAAPVITPKPTVQKNLVPATGMIWCSFRDIGEGEQAERNLSKPLYLVSIGGKYHEGDSLKATISLFNKKHAGKNKINNFNHVDILMAGALQRHNYWIFAEPLSDTQLKELFEDVPEGLNLEDLAAITARKFYPYAKKAEEIHIRKSINTFSANIALTFTFNFIHWESIIPIPGSNFKKDLSHSFDNYNKYYNQIRDEFDTNAAFAQAFNTTSERILVTKHDLIMRQAYRIRNANEKLMHFTDQDLVKLAKICSRNYLLEECPLFAELADQGYTSILYPGAPTEAFKVTQSLFMREEKFIKWVTIHHKDVTQDDYGMSTDIQSSPTPSLLAANRSFSGSSLIINRQLFQRTSIRPNTSPKSDPGPHKTQVNQVSEISSAHTMNGDEVKSSVSSGYSTPSGYATDVDSNASEVESETGYTSYPITYSPELTSHSLTLNFGQPRLPFASLTARAASSTESDSSTPGTPHIMHSPEQGSQSSPNNSPPRVRPTSNHLLPPSPLASYLVPASSNGGTSIFTSASVKPRHHKTLVFAMGPPASAQSTPPGSFDERRDDPTQGSDAPTKGYRT